MQQLKIIRDKWQRGVGADASSLLTQEGKMCCLGFCLKDIYGVQEEKLLNKATPAAIGSFEGLSYLFSLSPGNIFEITALCSDLMVLNDATLLNEDVREEQLTNLFRKINIEVEFV